MTTTKPREYFIVFREYAYEPTQFVCATLQEAEELVKEYETQDEEKSCVIVPMVEASALLAKDEELSCKCCSHCSCCNCKVIGPGRWPPQEATPEIDINSLKDILVKAEGTQATSQLNQAPETIPDYKAKGYHSRSEMKRMEMHKEATTNLGHTTKDLGTEQKDELIIIGSERISNKTIWHKVAEENEKLAQELAQAKERIEELREQIKIDSGLRSSAERKVKELTTALEKIAEAKCPSHMAHPQSVWWSIHVQSIANEAIGKDGGGSD